VVERLPLSKEVEPVTVLDILTYPDKFLKKQTAPVENIDGALQTIFDNMAATMYQAPGIGLAAPQVGIGQSFVIYDIAPRRRATIFRCWSTRRSLPVKEKSFRKTKAA
jgi:peptide deformylase